MDVLKVEETSGHTLHHNCYKSVQGILVKADYAPIKSSHLGTHLCSGFSLKISPLGIL